MRYWWVNQKQPHRHEIFWSPKRKADLSRNRFYDNMKAESVTEPVALDATVGPVAG